MANIKNVAIIGAGQMGCGIAHVFALAGYRVLLNDINAAQLSAGLATIEKIWRAKWRRKKSLKATARRLWP